ncbi:DinB family protein [Streptomyces sp. NPDC048603]|uniref:DinB family protein n=1 Tax=Streptomyces sp. NPDC048603 TaxID=3365577 RepID=UPI0037148217
MTTDAVENGWQGLALTMFRQVRTELARVAAEAGENGENGETGETGLARVAAGGNRVGWLVWHVARGQDRNLSEVAGTEQVWLAGGWAGRFGRPADPADTGYGHTEAEAAAFAVPGGAALLTGYLDAVHAMIEAYLAAAPDTDLARVAPSPTLGTADTVARRLSGQLADSFAHLGQLASGPR